MIRRPIKPPAPSERRVPSKEWAPSKGQIPSSVREVPGLTSYIGVMSLSTMGTWMAGVAYTMIAIANGVRARLVMVLLNNTAAARTSRLLSRKRLGDFFPRRSVMLATMGTLMALALLMCALRLAGLLGLLALCTLTMLSFAAAAIYSANEVAMVQEWVKKVVMAKMGVREEPLRKARPVYKEPSQQALTVYKNALTVYKEPLQQALTVYKEPLRKARPVNEEPLRKALTVYKKLYRKAQTINKVCLGIAGTLGGVLGGVLATFGQYALLFGLNALSYVPAIWLMARSQQGRDWPRGEPAPGETKQLFAEGLRSRLRSVVLWLKAVANLRSRLRSVVLRLKAVASLGPGQIVRDLVRRWRERDRGEAWSLIEARPDARWALNIYGLRALFFMNGAVLQTQIAELLGGGMAFAWLTSAEAVGVVITPALVVYLKRREATVKMLFAGIVWLGLALTLSGAAFSLASSVVFAALAGPGSIVIETLILPIALRDRDGKDVPDEIRVRYNAIFLARWNGNVAASNLLAVVVLETFGVLAASAGIPLVGTVTFSVLAVVYWKRQGHR